MGRKRSRPHDLNSTQSLLLWPLGLRSTCPRDLPQHVRCAGLALPPRARAGPLCSTRDCSSADGLHLPAAHSLGVGLCCAPGVRRARGDLGEQGAPVPARKPEAQAGTRTPALWSALGAGPSQGSATCWGPRARPGCAREGARRRAHVRDQRTGAPAPRSRADRPAPSRHPAQPSPRRVSRAGHREAARRQPRAAAWGRGRRPHCSSRSRWPSPHPAPGGARGCRSRGTWARAPPLSPGREPPSPRVRRSLPEPLCAAARRTGTAGRRAGGRSLSMDLTVSELMELFLQSPLVTWVSAPGSPPHCWCIRSSPARLPSSQPRPVRGPG